jgi:uncharacterized membrane protein
MNLNIINMEKTNKINPSGFFIPGFMFIGMGIGFIFSMIPVGIMIGMGTGFLATALYKMYNSKGQSNGKAI